jgi:pyruvate/2-oxoacid:ferredoxin oxidoreductase beta subunit
LNSSDRAKAFYPARRQEKLVEERQLVPVRDYLKGQPRLKLLTEEQIAEIQDQVDAKWNRYDRANE